MDTVYALKRENPKTKANFFSKLSFFWMVKLCYKGTKKTLEIADLYKTLTADQSQNLTDQLEKSWNKELEKSKTKIETSPSLTRAIIRTFFWKYMLVGFWLFVYSTLLRGLQPLALAFFIKSFDVGDDADFGETYIYGTILIVQSIVSVLLITQIEFGQCLVGMRVRIAVSSLVYRKMLRLDKKSIGDTAAGQVVNLLSNDVGRFDFVCIVLHYLWVSPFQIALITYLIWREMGVATLAGFLFMMCLTLPMQAYCAKLSSKFRFQTAQKTDYRVKLMNEVISGIQIIKMYAWEKPFEQVIKLVRKKEIDVITKTSHLRALFLTCILVIERTTLFLTVTCYVLLGNPITADKVFSVAQYLNVLQLALAICYPMAINIGAETLVSVKRLQTFLLLQEKPQSSVKTSNESIDFENVNAAWSAESTSIKNLTLHIPCGTLCTIVGPVGAGKSTILQLLLGELIPSDGTIKSKGTTSYVSQEPWLFASTVRNNILFGQAYDKVLYRKVVNVCALEKDFQQLPQGDKTVIGDKGVSLSGGQKARVNLARAVYQQGDVFLLDDPLSAVDTHVGKHLFQECILKHLAGKTRILVTHQLQYLQDADYIVVINGGRIEAQGTFQDLAKSNVNFTKFLSRHDNNNDTNELTPKARLRTESTISEKSAISEIEDEDKDFNVEKVDFSNGTAFKDYVRASENVLTILVLIVGLILSQAACNASDLWVTVWTEEEMLRNLSPNSTSGNHWQAALSREIFMYIYTGLVICAIIFTLARSIGLFQMTMTASKNLHNQMFHSLLQAPMRFFDTNSSGRVLNRFSKDIGAVDEFLPRLLSEAIQIVVLLIGILIMVAIANYYMIVVMAITAYVFLKIRVWYLGTAKDVKHLEGITKSQVFGHLTASYSGITTIRASKAEKILAEEFDLHQDNHTSAWFLTIATRCCFGLWLDMLSVVFISVVIYGFVLLLQYSSISASFVGLAISQSLILVGCLQYGTKQTAEVVNQLTSVERVMQYTKLENENHTTVDRKDPSDLWPSKGSIHFNNLTLNYSENNPPVLKNLNFEIKAGEKIGIVGRTGAGKSSLVAALFRLAPFQGNVRIDGLDTNSIELSVLRRKISIIPQESVLFSGTLRYNLDPFQEFEDFALWHVLEQVELKEKIQDLNMCVAEGGSNFSLGERQLLCLARAILRNNKILVLDEATANVDARTDSFIQRTIRKKFDDCTVLTIAHRLNTIMDSDRVLVMDNGRPVEFDHPLVLIQTGGYFKKMVAETGDAMARELTEAARNCYAIKD